MVVVVVVVEVVVVVAVVVVVVEVVVVVVVRSVVEVVESETDDRQRVASPKTEPGAVAFAPLFSSLHQQDKFGCCQVKYLCPRELHCGREYIYLKKAYQHLFHFYFT